MADFSKFRTSIGGFHRGDVSEYVERLCAEHQKALKQCEADQAALADKLAAAEKNLETQKRDDQALQKCEEEKAVLEELLAESEQALEAQKRDNEALRQCEAEKTALQAQLAKAEQALEEQKQANQTLQAALEEKEAALQAFLEPAAEEAPEEEYEEPEAPDYQTLELEAYRRAEAAERLAMERAARLRQSLNDLLDGVSSRYQEAGQEVHALTGDIRTNLKRLEETLSDLDLLFDEATESFDALDGSEAALCCAE